MASWKEDNFLNKIREFNDWSDKEIEYDDNNNIVDYEDSEGDWYKQDTNDFGKVSHKVIGDKDGQTEEVWYDYDENGNKIHAKYDNGDEEWYNPKTGKVTKFRKNQV